MRALFIVAGLFFAVSGAFVAYFAASDPGQEYDLKFVLPVDVRQMPKPVVQPVVTFGAGEMPGQNGAVEGRAEAGELPALPDRPPVEFGDRPSAASESRAQQ
jgi:hypothetical protein